MRMLLYYREWFKINRFFFERLTNNGNTIDKLTAKAKNVDKNSKIIDMKMANYLPHLFDKLIENKFELTVNNTILQLNAIAININNGNTSIKII